MTTDRYGWSVEEYPARYEDARLLGFNTFGNAVYATKQAVRVAERTEGGDLRSPPREYWTGHGLPLAQVGMPIGELVVRVAEEQGPWRALTDYADKQVRTVDENPDSLVAAVEDVDASDIEEVASALQSADDWKRREELAGRLRSYAMDDPNAVAPAVGGLTDLIDDVRGERERIETETTDPEGSQPFEDRTRNFARMAARRHLAFVIARVARERPDAIQDSMGRLVDIAGDRPYYDPETLYKEYLIDMLDALGRRHTATMESVFSQLLAGDDANLVRRTLNAVHNLAYRYPGGEAHPLLDSNDLGVAVDALVDADDEAVAEAAEAVTSLRGFHS